MTTVTELSIGRPPQHETTVTVVGFRLTDPHATNIFTDRIIPPSGTLTVDGDMIIDNSLTCDPLYVDDIHVKTTGGHIQVHDPLHSNGIRMGGNTATV